MDADPNQRTGDQTPEEVMVVFVQVLELKRPLAACFYDNPELRVCPGIGVAIFDVEFC